MIGLEQLEKIWSNLLALGGRRLAALGVVGVAVFAAVGFGSYYLSRTDFETLYSVSPRRMSAGSAPPLTRQASGFDVNSEGTKVLVRREETAQARALLAEKGLPGRLQRRLRTVRQAWAHRPGVVHAGSDDQARTRG